jgi:hypothetical protein
MQPLNLPEYLLRYVMPMPNVAIMAAALAASRHDGVVAAMGGREKGQGRAVAALTTNSRYVIDTNPSRMLSSKSKRKTA